MATRQREKTLARKQKQDKRPKCVVNYIRISPSKVRIVIDLIRGKDFNEALGICEATPKAASPVIKKALLSAVANAENNLGLNRDSLYVAEIFADEGITMKRIRAVSKGRAHRILKRSSRLTVILDERKPQEKPVKEEKKEEKAEEKQEPAKKPVAKKAPAKKSAEKKPAAKKPATKKEEAK